MAAATEHGEAATTHSPKLSAKTTDARRSAFNLSDVEENDDMYCADDEQKGGKSRFKVEFVDESRKKGQVNGLDSPRDVQKSSGHVARHAIGRERRDSGRSGRERWDSGRSGDRKVSEPDSPVLSVRSMSPTNTYVGYDTHNLKTFGHNTHEALPHVDHYRNLLSTSATHALKARPTLDELHEEKVGMNDTMMKCSPIPVSKSLIKR